VLLKVLYAIGVIIATKSTAKLQASAAQKQSDWA